MTALGAVRASTAGACPLDRRVSATTTQAVRRDSAARVDSPRPWRAFRMLIRPAGRRVHHAPEATIQLRIVNPIGHKPRMHAALVGGA